MKEDLADSAAKVRKVAREEKGRKSESLALQQGKKKSSLSFTSSRKKKGA